MFQHGGQFFLVFARVMTMLLTVREVARRLNVNRSTVYELVSNGRLSCHRVGLGRGTIRVSADDLDRYLESCRSQSSQANHDSTISIRPRLKHLKI